MPSSSTARFQKTLSCPAAEALVRYAREDLAEEGGARLALHVADCDFCGAEAQLFSRFAPPTISLAAAAHGVPLPGHLRRLAEDLLSQPSYNRARFAESLLEIERLTLTDA